MPDKRRAKCKGCQRHRDVVGLISWRGFCGECGPARSEANAASLHYKRGEPLQRWRRAVAASVGAVLPEDS